jgi:hypothetical protein
VSYPGLYDGRGSSAIDTWEEKCTESIVALPFTVSMLKGAILALVTPAVMRQTNANNLCHSLLLPTGAARHPAQTSCLLLGSRLSAGPKALQREMHTATLTNVLMKAGGVALCGLCPDPTPEPQNTNGTSARRPRGYVLKCSTYQRWVASAANTRLITCVGRQRHRARVPPQASPGAAATTPKSTASTCEALQPRRPLTTQTAMRHTMGRPRVSSTSPKYSKISPR